MPLGSVPLDLPNQHRTFLLAVKEELTTKVADLQRQIADLRRQVAELRKASAP